MSTTYPIYPLGDVVQIRSGGTPSKSNQSFWDGTIPWVSPKDMKSELIIDSVDHITDEAVSGSATSIMPAGSVLVVVRSGILARTVPVAVAGVPVAINQDIKALVPGVGLNPKYLLHALRALEPALLAQVSRGATVHRLETDRLLQSPIPLPPIEEQGQIAELLDEAFDMIAAAYANTQAKLQQLGTLRRSILDQKFPAARGVD